MRTVVPMAALGAAVLALTMAAVVVASVEMRARHVAGASITEPVNALIVLGHGIDADFVPTYPSRRRAEAAALLLIDGRAGAAIFTGQLGGFDAPMSGGQTMADRAEAIGAPPSAIIVEHEARTTFENLRFSYAIGDRLGFESYALVSDPYHLARAWALSAYLGRPDVGLVAAETTSKARPWPAWNEVLREALAWWYNFAKVIAWEALGLAGIDPADRTDWVW